MEPWQAKVAAKAAARHPLTFWYAWEAKDATDSISRSEYGDIGSGRGNAFRHCLWNCLMTVYVDVSFAKSIATLYEQTFLASVTPARPATPGPPQSASPPADVLQDSLADYFNNWVGRNCGKALPGNSKTLRKKIDYCKECCKESRWVAIINGERVSGKGPQGPTTPGDDGEENGHRGGAKKGDNDPDRGPTTPGTGPKEREREKEREPAPLEPEPDTALPLDPGTGSDASTQRAVMSGYTPLPTAFDLQQLNALPEWMTWGAIARPVYDPCEVTPQMCPPIPPGGAGLARGFCGPPFDVPCVY